MGYGRFMLNSVLWLVMLGIVLMLIARSPMMSELRRHLQRRRRMRAFPHERGQTSRRRYRSYKTPRK